MRMRRAHHAVDLPFRVARPGLGGAIPSRSDHAMSEEAFDKAMPNEFWREVVDLCSEKASDTLLLAEAFLAYGRLFCTNPGYAPRI